MTPRAVFDCMVFVQALVSGGGPASACYEHVRRGRLALDVSDRIIAEARNVLNRPKLRTKFPALSSERVDAFLDDVVRNAIGVDPIPSPFRLPRDSKDEPYIDLALAAGADDLVSRDRDLLDLMADDAFGRLAPSLTILGPAALLRLLEVDKAGA